MQSATEHCQNVLAAIIPNRRDLLDVALQHLTPDHFQNQEQHNIYVMLERYANVTSCVLTKQAMGDILRGSGADPSKIMMYEELYDLLQETQVSDGEFTWSVEQVRELAAERATAEAITEAMEILQKGIKAGRGQEYKGHSDARNHLLQKFAEIDRDLSMQEAPEGDIRLETDKMLEDYAARKKARGEGKAKGLLFGVPELDVRLGGINNGELTLVTAGTSVGKTTLCVQLGWHTAVMQGLNVVYFTSETIRPTVARKLVCRHSKLDIFGLPDGINTRDVRDAVLPEHLEDKFQEILRDFRTNPNYGSFNVVQMPRGSTMSSLESRLYRISRSTKISLVIIDSLQLMRSERKRDSDREELGMILKDAKQLSVVFDEGRGVPVISPWQVNRTNHKLALAAGYYSLDSLADTHEASTSPDVIVSLLEPSDSESRYVELRCQILKNRDGERASSLSVDTDYATCWFGSKERSDSMDGLIGDDGLF